MLIDELKSSLSSRDGALDARVGELNLKLANLQESVTGREAALDKQVQGIGVQMQTISGLFTNDRARGGWGEISMLRIFEMGGLAEGRDFTSQFHSGEGTPDAVVHLPGGRNIVIDSKFPVARYNEALASDDPDRRKELLVAQGKELEAVGKSLAAKGYPKLASGGSVVMYLPSQAVYEAASSASPEIIERLLKTRVIVAGPTSLFALMVQVGMLVTEHRAIQKSDEILAAAKVLRERMVTFVQHLRSIGTALTKTVESFNAAVGSWTNRVSPHLDRVNELNGTGPLDPLNPIDEAVRILQVEEAATTSPLN